MDMNHEQTLQSLEKLADQLEAEIVELERKIELVNDVNEIELHIGHYMSIHYRHDEPDMFCEDDGYRFYAQERDDCTTEISDYGVRPGGKQMPRIPNSPLLGCIYDHNLCTPMIAVADDDQTAKAVWYCCGFETDPRFYERGGHMDGHPVADWCWGREGNHFIKENGKWRYWHYHWYRFNRTPFYRSWADYRYPPALIRGGKVMNSDEFKTSFFNPYQPDVEMLPHPQCPEPYDTWTDDTPMP